MHHLQRRSQPARDGLWRLDLMVAKVDHPDEDGLRRERGQDRKVDVGLSGLDRDLVEAPTLGHYPTVP